MFFYSVIYFYIGILGSRKCNVDSSSSSGTICAAEVGNHHGESSFRGSHSNKLIRCASEPLISDSEVKIFFSFRYIYFLVLFLVMISWSMLYWDPLIMCPRYCNMLVLIIKSIMSLSFLSPFKTSRFAILCVKDLFRILL